ncbi:MAG TPA: hypothetical protein VFV01_29730 [Spirillospora sp.]|nr:hypothetical protein [Spirillospora sp.]
MPEVVESAGRQGIAFDGCQGLRPVDAVQVPSVIGMPPSDGLVLLEQQVKALGDPLGAETRPDA